MVFPLLIPQMTWIEQSCQSISTGLGAAIQRYYLQEGHYLEALQYDLSLELQHKQIEVILPASQPKVFYPQLPLSFDVFYGQLPNQQYLAFIPALGLESCAPLLDLDEVVRQNIKLEFARKKRLRAVQSILATQWYRQIKLHRSSVSFEFYTLHELQQLDKRQSEKILPAVAEKMTVCRQTTVGMNTEVERVAQALRGKYVNSVVLIGQSGVGKTAIIQEMWRQKEKWGLHFPTLWETTAARLIQKLTRDSGWQENLHQLLAEIRNGDYLLYVANLAELFEVGQYVGNNISIGEYLREYIQRGQLTLLSECSEEEAAVLDIRAPGYLNLFQKVRVTEPPPDELYRIVATRTKNIAQSKGVELGSDAVREILRLQRRYSPYSGFPGKTIRFLESVILNCQLQQQVVSKSTVIDHFCEETGMPSFMVDATIPLEIETVRASFAQNIFGQTQAIHTIVDLLAAIKTGLSRPGKPIASLLFVGPTGVGKTETAKMLAQFMFSDSKRMLRFDMSEFSNPFSVMRLTGESDRDGLLTAAVRQEPFSLILFDELEKADYSFYDLLLQILGEGRLADCRGKVADFCSTIIIMTSNIGARSYQKGSIGFLEDEARCQDYLDHFVHEVQSFFRPELFNRLDQIVAFAPLGRQTVRRIVDREIDLLRRREGIKFRQINLAIAPAVFDYLCDQGYDPRYGAREMQRTIHRQLLVPLAQQLNSYAFTTPVQANVAQRDNALDIRVRAWSDADICAAKEQDSSNRSRAETVTGYRRQAQKIETGPYFLKLLSVLDRLERQKKRQREDFWKKEQLARQYKNYTELHQLCTRLFAEINAIETAVNLEILDVPTESSDGNQSLQQWQPAYQQMKIQMYSQVQANANICTIGIYGSERHLQDIATIYLSLANARWQHQEWAVWFREEDYFKKDENGHPQKQYIKTKFALPLNPEKPQDKLTGIEIEFSGPMVHLYFSGEPGLHVWESLLGVNHDYLIVVASTKYSEYRTPTEIHRKQSYQGKVKRRHYQKRHAECISDKQYKVNVSGLFATKLGEILDSRLQETLDQALCDELDA